jgi:hypothetical protein
MFQAMGGLSAFLPRREVSLAEQEREAAFSEVASLPPQERGLMGFLMQQAQQTGIVDPHALDGRPDLQRIYMAALGRNFPSRESGGGEGKSGQLQRLMEEEQRRRSPAGRRSPTPPSSHHHHSNSEADMERLLAATAARRRGSSGELAERSGGEPHPTWGSARGGAFPPPGLPPYSGMPGMPGRHLAPPHGTDDRDYDAASGGLPPRLHGLGGIPPGMGMPMAFNHAVASALGLGGHPGMSGGGREQQEQVDRDEAQHRQREQHRDSPRKQQRE